MNISRDSQIDKLLEDIASIKSVLNKNRPILKQLMLPVHFRVIALISGLAFVGFPILYYVLLEKYGSYNMIPDTLRTLTLVSVVALYGLLVFLKRFLWMKSIKKINSGYTFGQLVKNIYSYQFLHVWLPLMSLMIFLMVYLSIIDQERFMVSVGAIGIGVMYNSIGGLTRIWQYIVTGYWLILTGLLPLILPEVSALIMLACSLGVGFLLFFLISGGSRIIEKEG